MKKFLRPKSIPVYRSVEGYGTPPSVEDYPFQGLDIAVAPYDYDWLELARYAAYITREFGIVRDYRRAGNIKHFEKTPFGTSVATLAREGHDILSAPCGYCGRNLGSCVCGKGEPDGV